MSGAFKQVLVRPHSPDCKHTAVVDRVKKYFEEKTMADEAPDYVLPASPAEGGEFTCPECTGHIYIQDKDDPTKGRCVGYTFPEKEGLAPHPVECAFTWPRSDDHKYFKPKAVPPQE